MGGMFVQHGDRQSTSSASLMYTYCMRKRIAPTLFQLHHAHVRVKGQPSTTPAAPCLHLQESIEGHELTLSSVCQICLKLGLVNQTFETFPGQQPPPPSPPSPTPPLCQPPCLSVTPHSLSSPPSSSLPSPSLSCCQSEQGFVTPGEGCLAVELS